ncbi:Terpene synthase [Melia azedarach]|uniref:Terpene synthase n=1 Tax=Melia azedarach TaxID=155640 RepID=A0ACC1X3M2_MELAZ|nr:Terpene synthase [Melia azedarach]
MVMKYQRKNGSLFNSPSTTAAALAHLQNDGCLHYLRSLLEKFVDAVPATYPLDIYVHLFMVETLQSLGIDRHFRTEINRVLDETYRFCQKGEEEIILDPTTCAISFHLLRVNGYDIPLAETLNPRSKLLTQPNDNALVCDHQPNHSCCSHSPSKSWVSSLPPLNTREVRRCRQKQAFVYFSVATNVFSPELSDARMKWAKSAYLTTVVDDFFDYGGSYEELENLVQLFENSLPNGTLQFHGIFSTPQCWQLFSFSSDRMTTVLNDMQCFERTKKRIKKMFDKIELSVSSYDTAWVAMVLSPDSAQAPCFPQCINWLLDNQLDDGSWGLPYRPSWLVKDAVSCTLASVLALKRWGTGEEHMNKDLNLNLPLRSTDINPMLERRHLELKRDYSAGRKEYLAYVSEGIGKVQDWEMVMKYQRKNGSLFNSPSTTAAALTHLHNAGCHHYLRSLLEKFGDAVPTIYPLDKYVHLFILETIESLGIHRHFTEEIRSVLDETYRCWLKLEEEMFVDPATCAMAFRLLRVNGHDVPSDPLTQFAEENQFFNSLKGYMKDIDALLELHRASQIMVYLDEFFLEKQNLSTCHFLKQLFSSSIHSDRLSQNVGKQVEDALQFPYHASLERLAHMRNMELYRGDNIRISKTSYWWVVEQRLDKLTFAKQKQVYSYFSVAATLFPPEFSDARMSWAKTSVLTTVGGDFFDLRGSDEELLNLMELLEKWDIQEGTKFFSEEVEILFSALHSTICELGEKTFTWQGPNATSHIAEVWLNLLKSMFQETQWLRNKSVPTMDEHMRNGYVSFTLGPILSQLSIFWGLSYQRRLLEVLNTILYISLSAFVDVCSMIFEVLRGKPR